jgi:DNA-binding Lrp family transcriptional regulator
MEKSLDNKDRRIIYELDKNARVSFPALAKKIGMNQETVKYRVKKLIKRGFIKKFLAVIDSSKLDQSHHKIYLRLQNVSEKQETELIQFLQSNDSVDWVVRTDGEFDLAFCVITKTPHELDVILTDFEKKFGQFVGKREMITTLRGDYLLRSYLIGKKREDIRKSVFLPKKGRPFSMNEKDKAILSLLGQDARMPTIKIAKKAGISPDTVRNRIKKLKEEGVIENFLVVLDNPRMGQMQYKILIGLHNLTPEKENALTKHLQENPHIFSIIKTLGRWQMEIDLEVETTDQFREIIRDIKNRFADILRDYSTLTVYEISKYNLFPFTPNSIK